MAHFNALREALHEEHPTQVCHNNTCDITAAMEEDCFVWAAHLLIGATECPSTEKAYGEARAAMGESEFDALLEEERKTVCAIRHIKCATCGSLVYTEEDEDVCGNCLSPVVRESKKWQDEEDELEANDGSLEVGATSVTIKDKKGYDVVHWDEDEWAEDPKLVVQILTAVKLFYDKGAEAVRARIQALPRTGG